MWKHIRRILMVVLAAVFLFCGGTVAVVQHQYQVNKRLYREAASSFTTQTASVPSGPSLFKKTDPGEKEPEFESGEMAPIEVDFEALKKVNPDVIGWIFCPDTGTGNLSRFVGVLLIIGHASCGQRINVRIPALRSIEVDGGDGHQVIRCLLDAGRQDQPAGLGAWIDKCFGRSLELSSVDDVG